MTALEEEAIETELARALLDGPGIVVLAGAFDDPSIIDWATWQFEAIIAAQRAAGGAAGDHFAASGQNDRIWNALEKLALRAPEVFADYYANDLIATACRAWLGPGYQVTSQVNVVNPGGAAQDMHRDYHLLHEGDQLMTSSVDKIAGAPISWGVCEVPGWGYQLSPARVLTEMAQVGLAATEFGPDGFLPADPAVMAEFLAARHLTAVGGFTPVVLHETDHDPAPEIERLLDGYDAARAEVLVLSAATGRDGYDTRPVLDEGGWTTLLANLDRLTGLAAARSVRAVLHPHVGTMVENGDEVRRVLEGSAISLCLDTGHLLIGGTDPAELTRQAPDRIAHTHFKDVDDQIAAQVRSGRLSYTEGVRRGMYRPLGRGDVDFAAIVSYLRDRHYDGWYVLEQDTILTDEPSGEGPVADVRQSADYLRGLLTAGW